MTAILYEKKGRNLRPTILYDK